MDSSVVIARGKGVGQVEEGKVGVSGGQKRLDFGGECMMLYADVVLSRCTLEARVVYSTNVTQ